MSFDSHCGARARIIAGALLVVLISGLDLLLGIPSLPIGIPILMGLPWFVVILAPGFAFWIWSQETLREVPITRIQNLIPTIIVGGLSALIFVFGWQDGIRYEGRGWTLTNVIVSCAFGTACAVLLVVSGRVLSPSRTLCIRFLIVAW